MKIMNEDWSWKFFEAVIPVSTKFKLYLIGQKSQARKKTQQINDLKRFYPSGIQNHYQKLFKPQSKQKHIKNGIFDLFTAKKNSWYNKSNRITKNHSKYYYRTKTKRDNSKLTTITSYKAVKIGKEWYNDNKQYQKTHHYSLQTFSLIISFNSSQSLFLM